MRRPPPQFRGSVVISVWALLAFALFHAVPALGCYMVNEHRRLVWYEIALLWLGDAIAVVWFLRYTLQWLRGARSAQSATGEPAPMPRSVWPLCLSLALGMSAELVHSLWLRHEESVGFDRAVPAVCTLTRASAQRAKGAAVYWKLDGQYQDAVGGQHLVTFYVRERDELWRLPPQLANAIRQGQIPLALPIVIDPQRPARSWIRQLGWDDGNRLHYLSLAILLFQGLFTGLFLVGMWEFRKQYRMLPWWSELHCVLPLAAEAFVVALFGAIEFYLVQRFCH